jgi:predicted alpha/beta-fold hydrolase
MPLIASTFQPPALLSGGHTQTILAALLPRHIALSYERVRLELPDGDFLDLDWVRRGADRVAIISHALEGSSSNACIRGMAAELAQAGWDVLAWNFRGCGGQPNRLPRFYHSADTGDLAAVIDHAASSYPRIALVGFSLGGNVTLKYLGESTPHPAIVSAVAISVPVDIAASRHVLDSQPWNRVVYTRRLVKKVVAKVREKSRQFPREFDIVGIDLIRTFEQFDGRYTAPLHGFRDAADYWARASSRPYLPAIRVPTLIINALNDPFLARECFPVEEARANPALFLETPASGGHVGFLDFSPKTEVDRRDLSSPPTSEFGFKEGLKPWTEKRAADFLSMSVTAPAMRTGPAAAVETATAVETAMGSTAPLGVKSAMAE